MSLAEYACLATIGAALLAVMSVFQWQLASKHLLLEVMSRVHERYSGLYDCLASLPQDLQTYQDLRPEEKGAISKYINLCSEQFYWWRWRKLIDNQVWKVWDAAIKEKLRHKAIALAWKEAHSQDTYYNGFQEYVDRWVNAPHE